MKWHRRSGVSTPPWVMAAWLSTIPVMIRAAADLDIARILSAVIGMHFPVKKYAEQEYHKSYGCKYFASACRQLSRCFLNRRASARAVDICRAVACVVN